MCPSVLPLDTLVYLLERKQTLESCEVEHFSSTVKKKDFSLNEHHGNDHDWPAGGAGHGGD